MERNMENEMEPETDSRDQLKTLPVPSAILDVTQKCDLPVVPSVAGQDVNTMSCTQCLHLGRSAGFFGSKYPRAELPGARHDQNGQNSRNLISQKHGTISQKSLKITESLTKFRNLTGVPKLECSMSENVGPHPCCVRFTTVLAS